jgi:hypothetical protein
VALEIIGAGLGRTGTMSLKFALEELGFGPCHHMVEISFKPDTWPFWARAYRGETVDWEEGYKGYRSGVDDPTASFYAQLAERYPKAKVILTHRDPERWFQSAQASALSAEVVTLIQNAPPEVQPLFDLFAPMGWDPRDPKTHDRRYMLDWFKRHNEQVKRAIAPERLLVYQVSEGWGPLCRFLGVAVPNTTFPRVNTTEDFLTMIRTGQPPKRNP